MAAQPLSMNGARQSAPNEIAKAVLAVMGTYQAHAPINRQNITMNGPKIIRSAQPRSRFQNVRLSLMVLSWFTIQG